MNSVLPEGSLASSVSVDRLRRIARTVGGKTRDSVRKQCKSKVNALLNYQRELVRSNKDKVSDRTNVGESITRWAGANPTGAFTEIRTQFVNYFDSFWEILPATGTGQYLVDLKNPLGLAQNREQAPVGKVESVRLSILPKFSLDSESSSIMMITGVPVATNTTTLEQGSPKGKGLYAAQRSTLVTPTASPDWVLVGEWDSKTMLEESNLLLISNDHGLVPLMEWQVLNPDNMQTAGVVVQMMIEYVLVQSVPMLGATMALLREGDTGSPWTGPLDGAPSSHSVVVKPMSVSNVV